MTIDEFERCISTLLAHARKSGITTIDMGSRDYYWTVTSPEWDMTNEPELGVGSLHDDSTELSKLLGDPSHASAVNLDRAAAMLRLLSDTLSIG